MLNIKIDPSLRDPAYGQIATQLRQFIMEGLLAPGQRLPPMRELAREIGVSLTTVQAAFEILTAENFLEARRGGGTFVSRNLNVTLYQPEVREVNLTEGELWQGVRPDSRFFIVQPPPDGVETLDFATGYPDPSLFPMKKIKHVVDNMQWTPKGAFLEIGQIQGYWPLIEHVDREMALAGIPMSDGTNYVTLTGGFRRTLAILLGLLLRPGKKVAIESPTYPGILNVLAISRVDHVACPMDSEGMDTGILEEFLRVGDVGAIVTVPGFHNPTGVTMSQVRRQHLLQLAAEYDVPVIEDDCGREIQFDGAAIAPLKSVDRKGDVICVGTFNKNFLTGLSIGWIVCPEKLLLSVVRSKVGSDSADSVFLQLMMYELIQRGIYARHIRNSIVEFRKRRDAMTLLLDECLPAGCTFHKPQGGLTLWLELPSQLPSLILLQQARSVGIDFLPAPYCMPGRQDAPALRLSFCRRSIDEIERGIPLLCQAIREKLNH